MAHSKRKGKRGELELAAAFREEGFDARRGQQFKGGPESPDLIVDDLPWLHVECKRVEAFRLWDAFLQARHESPEGAIPAVFHRKSRHPWVVVLSFEDFCRLAREYSGDAEPEEIGGAG